MKLKKLGQKGGFFWGLVLHLWFFPSFAEAKVSLLNGNFYINYRDMAYEGGMEPEVSRVYNSKTNFSGMFGQNWGSEYDVYLSFQVDGSIVVHEYGGGDETPFAPVGVTPNLQESVKLISQAAGNASPEYQKKLAQDAEFRDREYQRFKSKIRVKELPEGTHYTASRYTYQYMQKVKDAEGVGYLRSYENGKLQRFDLSGHLIRMTDRNQNFLIFQRVGNTLILKDNFNRKMTFFLNVQGLVEKVEGENKVMASYQYNAKKELIQSKDVENNIYRYAYDSKGRHNLVRIEYSNKTSLEIDYYSENHPDNRIKDSVQRIKEADGSVLEYAYEFDKQHPDTLRVGVKGYDLGKKLVRDRLYTYVQNRRADGSLWTSQWLTTEGIRRKEITYEEKFHLPLLIQVFESNQLVSKTNFRYDEKGRVLEKSSPTEWVKIQYNPQVNKIARVEYYPPGGAVGSKLISWADYGYDEKGNLAHAKTSGQRAIAMAYDPNGRIIGFTDQEGRKIQLRYNEQSRPIEVTGELRKKQGKTEKIEKLGVLKLQYHNDGSLIRSEVPSPGSGTPEVLGNAALMAQLNQAYDNFLEILEPAGVTLY